MRKAIVDLLGNQIQRDKKAKEWLDDPYQNRTRKFLEAKKYHPVTEIMFFPGDQNAATRIDEAIAVLKIGAGRLDENESFVNCFDALTVEILYQGGEVDPKKPIIKITGGFRTFSHLVELISNVLSGRADIMAKGMGTLFESAFLAKEETGLGSINFQEFWQGLQVSVDMK